MKIFNQAPDRGAPFSFLTLPCVIIAPLALMFLPVRLGVSVAFLAVMIIFIIEIARLMWLQAARKLLPEPEVDSQF